VSTQPEPLALDLLLSADERRPLTVEQHAAWRESLAAPGRDFDPIDELVAELRNLNPGTQDP
jgi:hypothetical protein